MHIKMSAAENDYDLDLLAHHFTDTYSTVQYST